MRVTDAGRFRAVVTLGWHKLFKYHVQMWLSVLAEDSITIAEDNYSKRIFRTTQASLGKGCQKVAIRSVSLEL
jgi:hypothetical protein